MQTELMHTARLAAPAITLVATGACGSMIAGLAVISLSYPRSRRTDWSGSWVEAL